MDHQIFDRALYRQRLARSAKNLASHNFLYDVVEDSIIARLQDLTREFPCALTYNYNTRILANTFGIKTLINGQFTPELSKWPSQTVCFDEEFIPFKADTFDLIVSNMSMHFINDLPGSLLQYRQILKPKGLFIATLFGNETLKELHQVLTSLDIQYFNGISPRISPFVDAREAAGLLQRANFSMPVVDIETYEVRYSSLKQLLLDLKGMGNSNCLLKRNRSILPKGYFDQAEKLYFQRFSEKGQLICSFDIITLTASKD